MTPSKGSPTAGAAGYCAIDFGTSNSAVAVPRSAAADMQLVELEPGHSTMPTAVFYAADGPVHELRCEFGRAAVAAYVDGIEGRLMRSMKSILGSTLVDQVTEVGGGRGVRYLDIVATYLAHLKRRAEATTGAPISQVLLGRPVFFVDGDPARDAAAHAALETAAQRAGFRDIAFQYEPIAAAFDYERSARREERVLVADIGGGTSDFSIVRVGPQRIDRDDRKDDILANHGVHTAGTDFDRRIEMASMLPLMGYGAYGEAGAATAAREVPSGVYFDLATWHLVNTVYQPQRVAELRRMRTFYADPAQHRRLMRVVDQRLGHDLLARAEAAKITVAEGGASTIDLTQIESDLRATLDEAQAGRALLGDLDRIVEAAVATVRQAGLGPKGIDALYFTGGSTGLRLLTDRLCAAFPFAQPIHGDRFASVASGLALAASRCFGVARKGARKK